MTKNSERVACLSAPGANSQPVLLSVHATGEISGLVLRMRLKQVYRNTGKEELETLYSFPLAWGTTLLGMQVTLNGKEMSGAVIEKREAEDRYEDAITAGDLPVMLVHESKDIYSARLGNLKPGDEATVEIEYGQMLRLDQGQIRVTVPTTIAPRFGRDPGLSGLVAHAIGAVDPLAEHRFRLALEIKGPIAQGKIHSPSHAVAQQSTGEGVRVELSQRASLDRGFILGISALEDLCLCAGSAEPGDDEGCTLLTGFVPRLSANDNAPRPAQLKFLVDCSGSMAGDGMRLAREGVEQAIRQLLPQDHVSFSCFGGRAVHTHQRMTRADERTVRHLLRAVQILEADLGGTELDSALREVIAIPGPEQGSDETAERSAILLITDGDVWDIDSIVRTVRASGHVIYAIGVGSAPAESLLRELAEVSGGACELIAPNENIGAAVGRLLSKLRAAAELEITIEVDGERLPVSPISRRAALGEMVHLWCQLERRPAHPPRLYIRERGGDEIQRLEPSVIDWDGDSAVARIGAAQRLLDVSDEQSIKEISLRYQLVTEQSSFFLVHERAALEKASGVPELHQIGNMMAAGWSGVGTVFASMRLGSSVSFDAFHMNETPRFLRRESPAPISPRVVWRRESTSRAARGDMILSTRPYNSFAQATENPDEPDNPLRQLLQQLKSANGAADALTQILGRTADSPSYKLLQLVLDQLYVIVESEEGALAVLLDWVIHDISTIRVSRRCLRPVSAQLRQIAPDIRAAACAYLAAESVKPFDPLPPVTEIFDIPAFLRRPAD